MNENTYIKAGQTWEYVVRFPFAGVLSKEFSSFDINTGDLLEVIKNLDLNSDQLTIKHFPTSHEFFIDKSFLYASCILKDDVSKDDNLVACFESSNRLLRIEDE